MINRKALFDQIRTIAGRGLHQPEVDAITRLLDEGERPTLMRPSRVAIDNIKRWESCKLTAYPDPGSGGDPWTIGWGSTGPDVKKGVVWDQPYADQRFICDVDRFGGRVADILGNAPTTQGQFDALVSLAYNIGIGALKDSTLLKLHKGGDYDGAAAQFPRWNKAGGKVLNGLIKRREAEQRIYKGLPA